MGQPGDLAQWNIFKIMTACRQITCESLDYRANSYHIHLNTLRFHGCGKEISQICPCPFCPINTSFSGTPPSYHSTAQNPLFWRWHCPRVPRTSARASFTNPPSLQSSSSQRNGHQLRRSWGESTIFFLFALLLYSYSSAIPFTEYPFFSFCSFILETF